MIKKILTAIFVIWSFTSVNGQGMEDPVTIPSPNAANLGKFGDVPVSLNTGAPNINVPLYSIDVRNVKLDIALNYDASGIRINRHPGWVGQNWSLQAGGVITRMTKGAVDESQGLYQESISSILWYNYFGVHSDLEGKENITAEGLIDMHRGNNDYQPDVFSFNFMGINGKFFLGSDGEWKVHSDQNLQIIFDIQDATNYGDNLFDQVIKITTHKQYDKVIRGFKIKDGFGNTYEFGYNDDAIEYSIDFFNQSSYGGEGTIAQWFSNAWYLTKVTDKYGVETFNFTYDRGEYIAELYRVQSYQSKVGEYDLGWAFLTDVGDCSSSGGTKDNSFGGNLISPVYLNKIESCEGDVIYFSKEGSPELSYNFQDLSAMTNDIGDYQNGFVPYVYLQTNDNDENPWVNSIGVNNEDFIKGMKWYKLSNIKIYGKQSTIKAYNFTYNDNPNERLFLKQIDLLDTSFPYSVTPEMEMYRKFDYSQINQLPNYFSKKVDHWGYYNGNVYSFDKNNPQAFFGQRNCNDYYLQFGLLSELTYPTKGSTKFKYEAHSYSNYVSDNLSDVIPENGNAGGVRIKEIIDFDGEKETSKTYKYISGYELNQNSSLRSGILLRKPKYYWEDRIRKQSNVYYKDDFFTISTIIPLGNSSGTHIGYSEVVEILEDGSYTIFNYTDYYDSKDEAALVTIDQTGSPYHPYSDKSFMRGKLKSKRLFDTEDNLIQETIIDYSDLIADDYTLTYNVKVGSVCSESFATYYEGNIYKIYYSDHDIKEEKVINYFSEGDIIEETTYLRENVLVNQGGSTIDVRLLKEMEKNLSGDIYLTEYTYPTDFTAQTMMQNLVDDFRVNEVIQSQNYKNNTPIGCAKSPYKIADNNYVLGESQWSMTDATQLSTELIFDKYIDGKLVEYHKPGDAHLCIIWGYDNKYPIAKIENATFSEIESYYYTARGLSNYDPDRCFDSSNCKEKDIRAYFDNLRSLLPNAKITSYTYDPGIGITSITDVKGVTTYYTYDTFNRLESVYNADEKIINSYEYHYQEETNP